jgi:predicted histidine transporter YuiF (NhaC family)
VIVLVIQCQFGVIINVIYGVIVVTPKAIYKTKALNDTQQDGMKLVKTECFITFESNPKSHTNRVQYIKQD